MKRLLFILLAGVVGLIVTWFVPRKISVSENEIGVVVHKLRKNGIYTSYVLPPGDHWLSNYKNVILCDLQKDSLRVSTEVRIADKKTATVSIDLEYALNPLKVPYLYKYYGRDYKSVLFIPTIRRLTRQSLKGRLSYLTQDSLGCYVKKEIAASELTEFINIFNVEVDSMKLPIEYYLY